MESNGNWYCSIIIRTYLLALLVGFFSVAIGIDIDTNVIDVEKDVSDKAVVDQYTGSKKHPNLANAFNGGRVKGEVVENVCKVDTCANIPESPECEQCRQFGYFLINEYRTDRDNFNQTAIFVCSSKGIAVLDVCIGAVLTYYTAMAEIVDKMTGYTYPNGTKHYSDLEIVDEICGLALQDKQCRLSAKSKKKFEWNIVIPDKAPDNGCRKENDACSQNRLAKYRALHVTDVHIQFDYAFNASSICNEPMCCRANQMYPQSANDVPAGTCGAESGLCDSPPAILPSFCADASKRRGPYDVLFATGDFIDHNFWDYSADDVIVNIGRIIQEIFDCFHTLALFVLGNHDTHPTNLFPPAGVSNQNLAFVQRLYSNISTIWPKYLKDSSATSQAAATLKDGGFYTYCAPGTNLCYIMLNNSPCFCFNFWLCHTPDLVRKQFEWLIVQLRKARNNGKKVIMLQHIPGNENCYERNCARNLRNIYETFSDVILGVFSGHRHYSDINVQYSCPGADCPVVVGFDGGSLTPYNDLGIKIDVNYNIVDFDREPNYPRDILGIDKYTFITADIDACNNNLNAVYNWQEQFVFPDDYLDNASYLSAREVDDIFFNRISVSKTLTSHYISQYVKGHELVPTCNATCAAGRLGETPQSVMCYNERGRMLEEKVLNCGAHN